MKITGPVTVQGSRMSTAASAFGEMVTTPAAAHPRELRDRLSDRGYLLLRKFIDPAAVAVCREAVITELSSRGLIEVDQAEGLVRARDPRSKRVLDELGLLPALSALIREPAIASWFGRLLDGDARPFDFTWLRMVPPGHATLPHADIVYMGSGCREILTLWTPLMRVGMRDGPLAVLEGSHRSSAVQRYASLDVDRSPELRRRRLRHWRWVDEGKFSASPRGIQKQIGGRWLTTEFQPGDAVVFRCDVLHCSLDNRASTTRLSLDARFQRSDQPFDPRFDGAGALSRCETARAAR